MHTDWWENLTGRYLLGDIGVNKKIKIILKWNLKKLALKVWTRIKWVRSVSGGLYLLGSRVILVGTVYRLRARQQWSCGSIPGRKQRLNSPPKRADRSCVPPSLLLNEY